MPLSSSCGQSLYFQVPAPLLGLHERDPALTPSALIQVLWPKSALTQVLLPQVLYLSVWGFQAPQDHQKVDEGGQHDTDAPVSHKFFDIFFYFNIGFKTRFAKALLSWKIVLWFFKAQRVNRAYIEKKRRGSIYEPLINHRLSKKRPLKRGVFSKRVIFFIKNWIQFFILLSQQERSLSLDHSLWPQAHMWWQQERILCS